MKPINITLSDAHGEQEVEIFCRHADQWPPLQALLGRSPDHLRAAGDVTDTQYQQLKVWGDHCGLMEMEATKCSGCPLAMIHTKKGDAPLEGWKGASRPPFAQAKDGKKVRR